MSKQNFSATIDEELMARLDAVAQESERNRSWLISQAIALYLEELEDLHCAIERLDEARIAPSTLRKKIGV
jgi:predicted DNA-binding protein